MNEAVPITDGTPPDRDVDILGRLGQRVRLARSAKGMPRRVLSEVSGVSPRYLAQLESGQGNISIALLSRVAEALGMSVADLLADTRSLQETRVLDLYRRADGATQSAVLRRLEVAAEVPDRAKRICLIGLRGAGKSTLGQAVGQALNLPFIELNKEIRAQGGMPVAEIMGLYGPEGYRQLEAEAVRRVASRHDCLILAVAGGIVSEPDTYDALLARYHTIWVRTSPEEHMERVQAQGDLRPMAGQTGAMDQLRSLLTERDAAYARAEAQLDTAGKPVDQSVAELLDLITERGFLG